MNFKILQLLCSWVISGILRLIPLSYIWGTCSAFFTLYQGAMPVSFLYNPFASVLFAMTFHCLWAKSFSLLFLVKGFPTCAAGLYLYGAQKHESSRWFSAITMGILCVCFGIFREYTMSCSWDYVYVIPWLLVPIAYHFSFFWRVLGALYLAHALGTVIYMFCGCALPAGGYACLFWQTVFERLILTITAVAVKNFVSAFSAYLWKKRYAFKKCFSK